MKSLTLVVSLVLFPFIAQAHPSHGGHLKFESQNFHAHLTWLQGPKGDASESEMQVEWHDATTHAIAEPTFEFTVELMMPSMGHGSSPVRIERALDSSGQPILGTFNVSEMYFTMPGAWDVEVKIKDSKGLEETKAWSVDIEGGNGHHH
jgi:hypothetical protein